MQNYSEAVQNAFQKAFQIAQSNRNPEVTENHLLLSFLEDPQGYFYSILDELQGQPEQLVQKVTKATSHLPTFTEGGSEPQAARNLQNRIVDAQNFAKEFGDSYVSSDHFLLSFWKGGEEPFLSWKKQTGISLKQLQGLIQKMRGERHMDSPTAEASMKSL